MITDRIAALIKIASIEFDKRANPILAEYNLTSSQCRVLKFLYIQKNQTARIVDIEKECAITHPTVLRLLGSLEEKGFIIKTVNPKDSRSKLVTLTEKAKALQSELENVVERLDRAWVGNLTKEERKELQRLLLRILKIEREAK